MSSMLEVEEDSSPTIHIPKQWSLASHTIASNSITTSSGPPIVFICGPKNSGKTTFSRYLLNNLLPRYKKVAYLDTDVGQPEFTVPGFLSLTFVDKLSTDLTIPCLKTPERCFFYGDISSKRDPRTYLKYISTLYNYYGKLCTFGNSESPNLPLVVNTPGWVKGVGYDILVDMVSYIAPTHVVKMNTCYERKNLPAGAFWQDNDDWKGVNLLEIDSVTQDSFNRSILLKKDAHHLRDLRIMAYFRQCFSSSLNITTIKELANALASHPPYQLPLSTITIKHLHCQVPRTEIMYSLNASIVGLAVSSEQLDSVPLSVGLGIVRGIDTLKGLIYMITPVPPSILEKVDLLLQGFIQIPTCLFQVQGCISPYMSTNVLSTS